MKKLENYQKQFIANDIMDLYDIYDKGRQNHKDDMETLKRLIFESQGTDIEFGSKVILPTIYKLNDTLMSYLNEIVFTSNDTMFDVVGEDKESQEKAQTHKYDLINDLHKMGFKNVMSNDAVPNFTLSGEFILFVGTGKKEVYKRSFGIENILNTEEYDEETIFTKVEKKTVYEGIDVSSIPSQDFVIDKDKNIAIIRKFMTYSEVVNNFKLISDDKEYFYNLAFGKEKDLESLQIDKSFYNRRTEHPEGMLEVLEYWGDYQSSDGSNDYDYENYQLVVIEGRLVICDVNPYFNNPIVYYAPIIDPNTKRGISPLRVAVIPNAINSNIVNTILDLLALQQNPPKYVMKGGLKSNENEILEPGKIIEIEPKSDQLPMNMDFQSGLNASINALPLFEQEIQSATGLYDNMTGAMTHTTRTATELQLAASGGSLRINNLTDKIVSNVVLAIIEKIALLKANTEIKTKNIMVQNDGISEFIDINPEINHGNYRYTYVDRKTATQREAGFTDFLSFAKLFLEFDPTLINIQELFKYGASQKNINNVEQFIEKDKLDETLSQLSKEYQMQSKDKKVVREKLAEHIPMVLQELSNGQENAGVVGQTPWLGTMESATTLSQGIGLQ